ncbi:hypothetical protein GCM10009689_13600 [Brevibacterium antiquum]|uniref:hypothetical protein n=1 Tax=Brevibacterium antiquum TaxID=234835 RepID=UPI0018E064BB|nr:hypothetical protein [Brevibacterium antiquum]
MPVTHELSRTAAALGTALALVLLPITGTIAPANASVTDSGQTNSSSSGTTTSDPDGSPESTGVLDPGDMTESVTADSDSESAEADAAAGDEEAGSETDAGTDGGEDDLACDPKNKAPEGDPCDVKEPLNTTWNKPRKTIRISPSEELPESWKETTFQGPSQEGNKRWPVQKSSDSAEEPASTANSAESNGDTDDSGNRLPPTAEKDVPTEFQLDKDGYVVDADHPDTKMVFEYFTEDPEWTFDSEEGTITVKGDEYTSSGNGDDGASDSANTEQDANSDGGDMAGDNVEANGNETDTASSDTEADGTDSGSNSAGDNSESNSTSDSNTSSDSESESSSDSISADSAKADSKESDTSSSSDADSTKQNSDSDSSSASDGSDSGSSDDKGNSDKDGSSDDKGSADKDGSGTTSSDSDGGPVGDDSTPDPATGNGSSDTRDEIPGDVGEDWLPGNGDSPPPDYSDPVPQNPDTPVPDDDKDLITGGETPKPRSDKPPSTSFGESIVSTIASSWPIFILAASGMAAVGFIIWIVSRRNKQN